MDRHLEWCESSGTGAASAPSHTRRGPFARKIVRCGWRSGRGKVVGVWEINGKMQGRLKKSGLFDESEDTRGFRGTTESADV